MDLLLNQEQFMIILLDLIVFYLLVKTLFGERSKEKYILFYPDFNEYLLGDYEMPNSFNQALETSRNKLRKNNNVL